MDIGRKALSLLLTYFYNLTSYSFLTYFHQAHYDAVQQKKKASSRQASLKSGNLAMTVEEDEEKEEQANEDEEMLSGKRRHFTMPESVV